MTPTTTPTISIGTPRGHATLHHLRRSVRVAGAMLAGIGSRWNDFVDAGQLGSSAESLTSRHTGGRI